MVPANHDLTIYRDRDFSQTFYFKSHGEAMDLTDYEARAEMRPIKDSTTLIAVFTATINIPAGSITLTLTDVQTLALKDNKAFWDLVLTDPDGLRQPFIEGQVNIQGTVTRVEEG